MSRERLKSIIDDFSIRGFVSFFRQKSTSFAESYESLDHYDDKQFTDFLMIGEIKFDDSADRLVIMGAKVNNELTDRSGKKAQYEKAKRILKDFNLYNAGIFIFYNDSSKFRFSLVYEQSIGTKRIFNNFRRFTYFVSPEFTNRTFLQQIGDGDFSSLDNIKDSFSVEKVNKEFYGKIAEFFYELVGSEVEKGKYKRIMKLPVKEDEHRIYQEFAVRLIGRTIFCWFLKYKKSPNNIPLIPNTILSSKAVLMDYYHSVLEKLFFEVLNTPQDQRKKILTNSGNIPFLNGGLFEPHQHDFYNGNPLYSLTIPDNWFTELLGVLEQYNFTIDENSTVDVDISVDPEMLGRIFENLLAEINPETGKTARKATGSYYTPRPIVEYMVDESLKQYLITKTNINEESVASLLSYETSDTNLNENEKDAVIKALDEIKAIDPACGSGAFPMGILQKMLLILQKVDPESKKWLGKQLDRIENEFYRKEFEEKLKNENWDYVHKLGIIQNSIYGVDIQPIAVDISRLRFFLSLIVDEKIDDDKPNRGVEPLPNLEFKFVSANSLIGLGDQPILETPGEFDKLRELRTEYLNSRSENKKHIEEKFREIQMSMFKRSIQLGGKDSQTLKISSWDPFSDDSADWFDSEWMFGFKNGFDIVIGNPPYVLLQANNRNNTLNEYFRSHYKVASYKLDLYHLFIEHSVNILKEAGTTSLIIPSNFTSNNYTIKLRRFLLTSTRLEKLVFFDDGVFDASVHNLVFVAHKTKLTDAHTIFCKAAISNIGLNVEEKSNLKQEELIDDMCLLVLRTNNLSESIIHKMNEAGETFGSVASVNFGMQLRDRREYSQDVVESPASKSSLTKFHRECYAGKDVHRFYVSFTDRYCYFNRTAQQGGCWDEHIHNAKNKILVRQIGHYPEGGLDECGFAVLNAAFMILPKTRAFDPKFLLGLLNSSAIRFYWLNKFRDDRKTFPKIKGEYLKLLPVPKVDSENQISIVKLVDQVVTMKRNSSDADTTTLEHQIDEMVYELYGLTPEEIAIVEGKK